MRTKEANPFRLAKKYLAHTLHDEHREGKQEFICHALKDVWAAGECKVKTCNLAKAMVLARLRPYGTVNCYVLSLRETEAIKPHHAIYRNIQFFRHRWLDHLADEWDQGVRK